MLVLRILLDSFEGATLQGEWPNTKWVTEETLCRGVYS